MCIINKKNKQQKSSYIPEITADDLPESKHPALRDKILGGIILFILILVFLLLIVFLCRKLFFLAANPKELHSFIKKHGALGHAAFLGIQILQGFLPIPLELTTIAGGYTFGSLHGCILTICSVIISTTIIFYFTKIFGTRLYQMFFTSSEQMGIKYIRRAKFRNMIYWIIFLIPGTPKRIFVFTAGLVPQRFRKFLFISTAARIPSLLACSFGGFALSNGNYAQAVTLLGFIGILSIAGIILFKYISNKTKIKGNHFNMNKIM